jgi:F0F1-type ATP synthase assembly protein I
MPSDNNSPNDSAGNDQRSPTVEKARDAGNVMASALELPFVFAGAVVLGGFLGYLLDSRLHTKPVFLIIFGIVGFIAGVREVIRRVPSK